MMRSIWGTRTAPHTHAANPDWIHPALVRFADECSGTLARLIAYMGALGFITIVGVHLWDLMPAAQPDPTARADWSPATRSVQAFAISQPESIGKTATYEILRHPDGGRKDVIRWATNDEKPVAELEVYRPGAESSQSGPAIADMADRMDPGGAYPLEAAGVIESKFGPVTLLRMAGQADGAPSCVGFLQHLDNQNLRISGWSCQGDGVPARRAAIGCMLNRLTLLSAGNDPKLAETFARAELKRGSCAAAASPSASASWVTEAENPSLRGGL